MDAGGIPAGSQGLSELASDYPWCKVQRIGTPAGVAATSSISQNQAGDRAFTAEFWGVSWAEPACTQQTPRFTTNCDIKALLSSTPVDSAAAGDSVGGGHEIVITKGSRQLVL